ncbi:hypothetical protein Nizo2766_2376 [Lactiplantibacillus plantarum]|nr:hypothetical protein Nizo2766_2376 [Lactiplantibacillus plantarum]KZU48587.1 hypothetical protein Nizo2757_0098 [Lactiplantibacillus plantarum]
MNVLKHWIRYHRQALFKGDIKNPNQFPLLNKYGVLPKKC